VGINTFTRFVERASGVDVELETIGLSRRFPRRLGWLIEPIARRLGRRSVERTLTEFGLAVRNDASADPVPPALRAIFHALLVRLLRRADPHQFNMTRAAIGTSRPVAAGLRRTPPSASRTGGIDA
jgi:hypothetical protein